MADYKHGTYGEFAPSVGEIAQQSGTVAVYVGTAPVNLIRGFAERVNSPVRLANLYDVRRYLGYSMNWDAFTLCEAFKVHFDNPTGQNIGPVVAINVLDPETHVKSEDTTKSLAFSKGRATIASDTIILDTLVLADKVEGTDYSVAYDFDKRQVVISSIGEEITGTVQATYSEVDPSAVTVEDVIGGLTADGEYSGFGCINLIYQEIGLIPNIIACPKWSGTKEVYDAMTAAATKINGHWDAFCYADIPIVDGVNKVDTIEKAVQWKDTNGYDAEIAKPCYPMGVLTSGEFVHASTLAVWRQMLVDATHDGIPMESASNKPVPVVKQHFGEDSTNRGFDQQQGNVLNAAGITTLVYWGGQWRLWGPHTGAYKFGAIIDNRSIFDVSIRMMMHVSNSFQRDHALTIDQPMTRAMADTIKNREQEKLDALAAVGAFIGTPIVEFRESDNPAADLVEGNFTWYSKGTTTPPFKSGTLKVAYTTEGFATYFGEV